MGHHGEGFTWEYFGPTYWGVLVILMVFWLIFVFRIISWIVISRIVSMYVAVWTSTRCKRLTPPGTCLHCNINTDQRGRITIIPGKYLNKNDRTFTIQWLQNHCTRNIVHVIILSKIIAATLWKLLLRHCWYITRTNINSSRLSSHINTPVSRDKKSKNANFIITHLRSLRTNIHEEVFPHVTHNDTWRDQTFQLCDVWERLPEEKWSGEAQTQTWKHTTSLSNL